MDEIEPLDDDVAALFAAERRAPRPSALREATIFARLRPVAGVAAALTAGAVAETSSTASVPGAAAGGKVLFTASSHAVALAKGTAVAVPASKALVAGVLIALGSAGVGTSIYLAARSGVQRPRAAVAAPGAPANEDPTQTQKMQAAETAPPSSGGPGVGAAVTGPVVMPLAPVPAPPAPPAVPAVVGSAPTTTVSARASATAPSRRADMAAESELLEGARRALARGQASVALTFIDRHARAYPSGFLTEEREVLWVRALVLAGNRANAERRAAAFRKAFPKSIQQEALARAFAERP